MVEPPAAERKVTVGWPDGLHARPAALFVRAAAACGVPVTIAKPGQDPVNAASLLRVMALGVQGGDEVVLAPAGSAEGTAEVDSALDRLAAMVRQGLDALPPKE